LSGKSYVTPIFTLNRDDVYDYQRCPKIVAFKAMQAMKALSQPAPKPVAARHQVGKEPQTIGRATELAVETALSIKELPKGDIIRIQQSPQVQQLLQRRLLDEISPSRLTAYVKLLAADALKGAITLRKKVEESYGNIRLLGRCESRNPLMPSKVQPDYVAFAEGTRRAILIESKGSVSKSAKHDQFQASYYNGIASKFGVMLVKERTEHGSHLIAPLVKFNQPAETIILYPRRKEFNKVQHSILVDQELASQIWEAKQLGMRGKLPETDCASNCPHSRYLQPASEDTLEPAPPLPLIFAEGYNELDYDVDAFYQRVLASKALPREVLYAMFLGNLGEDSRDRLVSWLTDNLGLEFQVAADFVKGKSPESKPDAKKLMRSMANEIDPWKKILGKRFKTSAPVVEGLATSIYGLPHGTSRFIKSAWKRWTR